MIKKPELLIFDVNETLLDLNPLKESVNTAMQNNFAFDIWFPMLLQYSLVETVTHKYHDFSEIGVATFKMIAKKMNRSFSEEEIKEVLSPIKKLPPHPEVIEALHKLREQGFRMIALTNGKPSVAEEQLKMANIDTFFEEIISVEMVRKYKPHRETYEYVLQKAGVSGENAMLIAAHGWDIAGAKSSGLKAAFIRRKGKSLYPLAEKPDLEAEDLLDFVHQMV
ncbi:haloacid dehalogenase type II [Salegentibacter sp. F188]|uniref:Haloacid dehalogenase type II n=1 Tax=Autumnicola patrickiae TaxID=3075591 RepID=A0ABU3E4I8_9FLAO|nr:haloacid dehalogenase type II [Salegentibacter sp. F188]MDT0690823.1 haloacid dehalogenase type II [Salegentibacter sp. F188]